MSEKSDVQTDSDILTVTKTFRKIYTSIVTKSKQGQDVMQEIEEIKNQITAGSTGVTTLVACQTLVSLCDDSLINTDRVVALLLPLLQNASFTQYCALVGCITEFLLIDLRQQTSVKTYYRCPFQIIQPQHPILLLFPKSTESDRLHYIFEQLIHILNHHDKRILNNSTEFLRPVLMYIFSSQMYSDTLWKNLLHKGKRGEITYQEIILFARTNTPAAAIYTSNLISKAIKYFLSIHDDIEVLNLVVALVAVSQHVSDHGFSVQENLETILRVLFELEELGPNSANLIIMLLADLLQIISPFDLSFLVKILQRMIVEKNYGNSLALFMVLDGLIQRVACPIKTDCVQEIEEIITFISTKDMKKRFFQETGEKTCLNYMFFGDQIPAYYEFDMFLKTVCVMSTPAIIKSAKLFFKEHPLMARGLFLSSTLRYDAWLENFSQLIAVNKSDKRMQNTWLMPYIYKTANEMHPKTKNLLLKNLPEFGHKDPVINTIACLAKSTGKAYAIDLYLKLWIVEPRTYVMLNDALKEKATVGLKTEKFEVQVTKAVAIKRICELKPSQHGTELVQMLSEILNDADDMEIPVILALDSLAMLCENHVVNIVSTWKAISFKFRYEKRSRVLKALFNFFSKIPALTSATEEFEKFTREVIERLWYRALHNIDNEVDVCAAAIDTLAHFPESSLYLADVPEVLKKGIVIEEPKVEKKEGEEEPGEVIEPVVPPEIWIRLMENTYRQCIDNVSGLVAKHISEEIKEFKGGVYLVPEGRPEPKDMKNLPPQCLLRCIIQNLIIQSRRQTSDDYVICGLLKSLTTVFSKPMPPLDWSFLHEFFHNGQEIKHNCIRILCNQLSISGSARRMIENYINNFDPNNFQEEDIAVLYEKLAELTEYISTPIYTQFIRKSIEYANSPEASHLLLEHIFTCIPNAFINKEADTGDNLQVLCATIEKSMQSFDITDEIFIEKFTKLVQTLPLKLLDKLIASGLDGKATSTFKKSLALIQEACFAKGIQDNPLNWLLQAIDAAQKNSNFQIVTLEKCADIFAGYSDSSKSFKWVSELLAQIQNILTTTATVTSAATGSALSQQSLTPSAGTVIHTAPTIINMDNCLFLIDVLLTSVIALAGNGFLIRSCMDNENERNCKSFSLFPMSLNNLLQTEIWKDNQGRVLEFLFHFHSHPNIPESYAEAFRNTIISTKNQPYFDQAKVWQKFIMMRR